MSANRIQKYLPANRIAQLPTNAVNMNCASFACVGGNTQTGAGSDQIYQLAWEAARQQVSRKNRFRQAVRRESYVTN